MRNKCVYSCSIKIHAWFNELLESIFCILWKHFPCIGFSRIQNTVVDQTGSRPPVTMTFFGASLALGSALEILGSSTELVIPSCLTQSTFCHMSQSNQEMVFCCYVEKRWQFKMMIFLICGEFMRYLLIKLFHLSNLLQMPTNHRMVDRVLGKLLV